MRTEETDLPPQGKATPCAGCPEPSDSECEVWGSPFCYRCANAWNAEAPSQEDAEKKYPKDDDRYAAWRKFTAEWAAKRRAKARAA